MATTEERLDKAGASFKALEKRTEELEKKYDELSKKFELLKNPLVTRQKEMIEVYKWFLERLIKNSDESANKEK